MNPTEPDSKFPDPAVALISGRSCGYCTVCCYATQVDTPEFQKLPGVTCKHCTGRGCGIYEKRYPACHNFHCGWWSWDQVGDDWRPDRSGVLILAQKENLPAGYRTGWQFVLLGGESAIIRSGFIEGVFALMSRNVALCIVAPAPPGHNGRAAFVNELLSDAARRGDRKTGIALVLQLWRKLADGPFDAATFKYGPPLEA